MLRPRSRAIARRDTCDLKLIRDIEMAMKLGIAFGILFLLGGILGFVPGMTEHDMFLGVFMVKLPPRCACCDG